MATRLTSAARALILGLLAWSVAGCVSLPSTTTQGRTLEPLEPSWERIFKLQWEIGERRGEPVITGYLMNDSPYDVERIRVLVEGLDESGAIAAQRLTWVLGQITAFSRVYLEAPVPGRYPRYQVRVFAYDRIERGAGSAFLAP
jgi:hypothetical protein